MENNTSNGGGLMSFELPKENASIIKVIGVGGGGSNAVNHMFNQGIRDVNFVVCNTDSQALASSPVPNKIQLGASLTEGRGAGSIPDVGRNAALESIEEIKSILSINTKMVFITAGMGGGTGTGAAPVIAAAAKEMGILTVGIVTVPFMFEGRKRKVQADDGLEEIRKSVDTLIVISNEKLREMHGNLPISTAFSKADDILTTAAKSIAEIITVPGYINVDFADVRTVMCDSGNAIMGSAMAEGENRAQKAVEAAMASPLLSDNNIKGARYVLLYITSGTEELLMDEISEITDFIQDEAGMTADIIWGNGTDESLGAKICVTVIAAGFEANQISTDRVKKTENVLLEVSKPIEIEESKPEEVLQPEDHTVIIFGSKEIETDAKIIEPLTQPLEIPQAPQEEKSSTEYIPLILDVNASEIEKSAPKIEDELYKPEVNAVQEESPMFTLSNEVEKEKEEFTFKTDVVQLVDDIKAPADKDKTAEELFKQNERMMRLREISHKLKNPAGLKDLENEPAFVRRNTKLEDVNSASEVKLSDLSVKPEDKDGSLFARKNSFLHGNVD